MSKTRQFFTSKNITRLAIFTALSSVLYMFGKFPLPIFPGFLEFHFSDLPALLVGFMMGPWSGVIVLLLRMLIKLPFTGTSCVGELADFIIGISFVLTASLIYKRKKTIKVALLALLVGVVLSTAVSMIINRVVLIPFYSLTIVFDNIIGAVRLIFPNVTNESFYGYYIFLSVMPFNLLRSLVSATLTFLLYKKLKKLFDHMFASKENTEQIVVGTFNTTGEAQTGEIAKKLARTLKGGEIILLSGELGAGKTVFVRALAEELKVEEGVVSPTFTLMNEYHGDKMRLVHIDAYRLNGGKEAYEAGLTEYFGKKDCVCCIEWAENVMDAVSGKKIEIEIKYTGDDTREIKIK